MITAALMMVLMALGAGSAPDAPPKRRRLQARRNAAQKMRALNGNANSANSDSESLLSLSDLSDSDANNQPSQPVGNQRSAATAAPAPEPASTDEQWPVVWFSTTLSKKGSLDIPTGWYDRIVSFIDARSEDGSAAGLERGRQKGNLHVQALIGLKCDPSLTPSQRTAYWKDQVNK